MCVRVCFTTLDLCLSRLPSYAVRAAAPVRFSTFTMNNCMRDCTLETAESEYKTVLMHCKLCKLCKYCKNGVGVSLISLHAWWRWHAEAQSPVVTISQVEYISLCSPGNHRGHMCCFTGALSKRNLYQVFFVYFLYVLGSKIYVSFIASSKFHIIYAEN